MPTETIQQLAADLPHRLRSYRGPLDLSWLTIAVDQWLAATRVVPQVVNPVAVFPILHDLESWIDGAPRRGMPAYIYPILSGILQRLFSPCPVQLLLLQAFRRGSFHAHMHYWQAFPDRTPYRWDRDRHRLTTRDWQGTDTAPPPGLCVMLYSSRQEHNGLSWPATHHEIGHHVYQTLIVECLRDRDNQWLDDFTSLRDDIGWLSLKSVSLTSTVSDWLEELFCDMFAAMLFGPSYALALRFYTKTPVDAELTHPPLAMRLDSIRSVIGEQLKYIPDQVANLINLSIDADTQVNGEPAPPRVQLRPDHPAVQHLQTHWDAWTAACASFIADLLQDTSCPVWHGYRPADAVRGELEYLISMLLSYVPPVGMLNLEDRMAADGTARLLAEPSEPGLIFLAAAAVRFCAVHWTAFSEPWGRLDEAGGDKAEKALHKLLLKGLADSHLQRRFAGGSQRTGDSQATSPRA